jgi:hypothetical protein
MKTKRNYYRGGSSFVGPPWSSQIAQWPGVGRITGATNYYALNDMKNDPMSTIQSERYGGGSRKRKRQRRRGKTFKHRRLRLRGGSDLGLLGKSMVYGVQNLYNNSVGNVSVGVNANGFLIKPSPLPEVQGKYTYPKL